MPGVLFRSVCESTGAFPRHFFLRAHHSASRLCLALAHRYVMRTDKYLDKYCRTAKELELTNEQRVNTRLCFALDHCNNHRYWGSSLLSAELCLAADCQNRYRLDADRNYLAHTTTVIFSFHYWHIVVQTQYETRQSEENRVPRCFSHRV